jgi:hypothetical protein
VATDMTGEIDQLRVEISGAADAEELDELTSRLRRQLLELDVAQVDRERDKEAPPAGSKVADPITLGALIVTIARTSGALVDVVKTVRSSLSGSRTRSVKLSLGGDALEVTGASSAEVDRAIDAWLERQATREFGDGTQS